MRFVCFGPSRRLGVVQGRHIIDLSEAAQMYGAARDAPLFTSLLSLIDAGEQGLASVADLLVKVGEGHAPNLRHDIASTVLQPPFPGRRFALAGSNYAVHVANGRTNRGEPITAAEVYRETRKGKAGGFWVVSPPVGTNSNVPVPKSADGLFDYEGEVAVVLGKGGKGLSADQWEERIWGTTLVIDWSIRSHTQIANRQPFYAHKNFDSSKSIGPWIAVGEEVDPSNCDVETLVNGEVRQQFNTRDMMHSFGELLAQMSEDFTLLPGDVLSGGTGPGTAVDSTVADVGGRLQTDLFLKPGDTVDVSSPSLGHLTAKLVNE